MNMKGVSPVVATVLLIAIAVIAAVGVWYWVGAYTSKPATTGADMKLIQVSGCTTAANNTPVTVLTRNLGSAAIAGGVVFNVYNSNMLQVGTITTTAMASLASNSTLFNNSMQAITTGTYKATSQGFQDVVFNC